MLLPLNFIQIMRKYNSFSWQLLTKNKVKLAQTANSERYLCVLNNNYYSILTMNINQDLLLTKKIADLKLCSMFPGIFLKKFNMYVSF